MINRIFTVALAGAVMMGAASCQNKAQYKKIKGVEYMLVKDAPGKNAQVGDIIEVNVVFKVGRMDGKSKDSVIMESSKVNNGKPFEMPLAEPKFNGDMISALTMMSAGDSGIIRVSVDTLKAALKGQPMPPFAKDGDYFIYEIKMVSVKDKATAEKEAQQKSAAQNQLDDKTLQDYFAKNNIKPAKTNSGVYYTIEKEGAGETINVGKDIEIKYTGKLLDGKVFDSNVDPKTGAITHPLPIKVGSHGVIPGMDEGVQVLKKGSKATLYIPSSLGYGAQGGGPIPANAILIFEVEVMDVKEAK